MPIKVKAKKEKVRFAELHDFAWFYQIKNTNIGIKRKLRQVKWKLFYKKHQKLSNVHNKAIYN